RRCLGGPTLPGPPADEDPDATTAPLLAARLFRYCLRRCDSYGASKKLPGVLESESQQRQSFLVFLYRLPGQYVELVGQTGRPAVQVQNVQEENQVQSAYRAPVVDPKIQRIERPAAADVRFGDLLREPHRQIGRQNIGMRDEPLSGLSRSVSPACRDLPALVELPA